MRRNCPSSCGPGSLCAWIGAVCVATNPKSAGAELAYFAAHTEPAGAVTQPEYAELLSRHCPGLKWIVATDAIGTLRGESVDRAFTRRPKRVGVMPQQRLSGGR